MYFQDANGEFAMEAGKMAEELGDNYQIFVIGKPRIFSNFPTFAFVAPGNRRVDLASEDIPTFELAPGQKAVFFSTPANHPWMSKIIQKYPGGRNSLFYRKTVPNEVLFEYYVVEP